MIPSQFAIYNPRALTIIALGAMVNRVSPELYLEVLLDRQADSLMGELADVVLPGADEYECSARRNLQ